MVTKLGETMMTHDIVASLTIKNDSGVINFEAQKRSDVISVMKTEKIKYQGNTVGSLELGLSRKSYNEQQKKTILIALVTIIVLIINVFWIVIYTARRFLKKTLTDFTHPIEALSKGNYQYEHWEAPHIELEGIIARFNQMASKIEKREKSLVEANQALRAEIEEREKVEKLLRQSEERYRTLNENLPVGVFRMQPSGEIISFNPTMDHLLDITSGSDENNKNANDLLIVSKDRQQFFDKFASDRQVNGFECQMKGANGNTIWVSISAQGVLDQYGHIQYFDGILENITKRRQTEAELERYRNNLEKMVNERTLQLKKTQNELVKKEKMAVLGQLTATVSHELRNPLGVIRSSNYFLHRRIKDQDAKTNKHFKRIDEQISLCDTIITDLLEYTHGCDVKLIQRNIASWLPEVIGQVKEQENITVELQIAPNLPTVVHDIEKMRRVVLNLLSNAAQAVKAKAEALQTDGENYTPCITVEIFPEIEGITIVVKDNGIGMDADTRRYAFEPLFTTRARGAGLGLAIVKKIIDNHGGKLSLKSRQGQSTQIKLFLPLIDHEN
jgi:PAS domain S-box-containing protein